MFVESQKSGKWDTLKEDKDDHPTIRGLSFSQIISEVDDDSKKDVIIPSPDVCEKSSSCRNGVYPVHAVDLHNVRLWFGRGSDSVRILRGINLKVQRGIIYGLLGPSGCGKTTLLRCIVGKLHPKDGHVRVFGCKPGSAGSVVPGRGIGYMPQELAVYGEFTIQETLQYFGRLHGMIPTVIHERTKFLVHFLDLPEKTRLVRNLSGGQQRRVSLAAALIHKPPLLILDEPTVGVDPLLRKSIWNYLVTLTVRENMTVIVTTHYIEEACLADIVGLMRKGRLLAEGNPAVLMHKMKEPTLEAVFLKLCRMDKHTNDKIATTNVDYNNTAKPIINNNNPAENNMEESEKFEPDKKYDPNITRSTFNLIGSTDDIPNKMATNQKLYSDRVNKTMALFGKNVTRLRRNIGLMLFSFLLPAVQMILFCICVGREPFDLKIGVVNQETPPLMSQRFLDKINTNTLTTKAFENFAQANESVYNGGVWGIIHIGENFTQNILRRYRLGPDADTDTIEAGRINLHLDMSNQEVGFVIQRSVIDSFQAFEREDAELSKVRLGTPPIAFENPIYGSHSPSFTEFMAPGVILSVTYIIAVGLTALSFVEEKTTGMMERGWVSGVTATDILVSQFMTQFFVLSVQITVLLTFTFLFFETPAAVPIVLIAFITLLQGACGMAYGIFVSSFCDQKTSCVMVCTGSFYPNILLSGVIWPIEGMPYVLRLASFFMPQTVAIEGVRAIFSRGWGLSYHIVWSGFLLSLAWTTFFLLTSLAISRLRI